MHLRTLLLAALLTGCGAWSIGPYPHDPPQPTPPDPWNDPTNETARKPAQAPPPHATPRKP